MGLSLTCEETDAPDVTEFPDSRELLLGRPLNNRLVRDSLLGLFTDGCGDDSEEEKLGGDITSCVCVSLCLVSNVVAVRYSLVRCIAALHFS